MSDHADGRPWTITRLLYSSQLPFLLLCTAVFAGAVLVLTFAIDLRVTITESVWDPAVSVVRWFAFGYGLYLLNRLLPLYVAAGRTAGSSWARSPSSWLAPGPCWPRCWRWGSRSRGCSTGPWAGRRGGA